MNLVNELQVSAEQDDVLTVLRKAKRLASKLGVDDINHWLRCEQEGYGENDALPSYRMVKCTVVYNTNGPVPVGYGMVGNGVMEFSGLDPVEQRMEQPMNEIVTMLEEVKSKKRTIGFTIGDEAARMLRQYLHPLIANQVTFMFRANSGQLRAIPEAVKDKVLEWALELERRGVLGENTSFNDKEKAIAHNITFNISNSQIEQLNNMGQNILKRKGG